MITETEDAPVPQYFQAITLSIFVFAIAIRLIYLPGESAWYDEVITIEHLEQPTFPDFLDSVRKHNPPVQPVWLAIEYYWAKHIGSSENSLRLLTLLPGILSIYLTFNLVRRLHSVSAANISILILAVSNVHIYYSIEIRMYSLVLALVLCSIYSYFKLVESNAIRWWILHIGTTGLIVWTHLLGVFILPCLALHAYLYGFNSWLARIGWTLLHSFAVFTIIPWLLAADMTYITDQYKFRHAPTIFKHDSVPSAPSIQAMLHNWTMTFGLHNYHPGVRAILFVTNIILGAMYTIGTLIFGFNVATNRNRHAGSSRGRSVFLLGLFLIPITILYAISHLWEPSFFPRYILVSFIAVHVILAVTILSLKSSKARKSVLTIFVSCIVIQSVLTLSVSQRRPWEKIAAFVEQEPYRNPKIVLMANRTRAQTTLPEVHHHLHERKDKVVLYREFETIEKFLLRAYTDGIMRGQHPRDIVLLTSREDYIDVTQYLDAHQVHYSVEHLSSRFYLKYLRLHPTN